uniref:Uncharacterized protein n=1 Tax=Oryza brachyantha TaxID=4533 RepID=J3MBV1_ORYBR
MQRTVYSMPPEEKKTSPGNNSQGNKQTQCLSSSELTKNVLLKLLRLESYPGSHSHKAVSTATLTRCRRCRRAILVYPCR